MPTSGVVDLARIGRRDGGDAVGELQAGLQEADAAVIFDAVDRRAPAAAGRARQNTDTGKWPWKARLWTVITVPGRRPPA